MAWNRMGHGAAQKQTRTRHKKTPGTRAQRVAPSLIFAFCCALAIGMSLVLGLGAALD
jgi:hypothetical protein